MKQQKRIVHQFGESSLCDFITLHLNFLGLLTDSLETSCRKKTIYQSSPPDSHGIWAVESSWCLTRIGIQWGYSTMKSWETTESTDITGSGNRRNRKHGCRVTIKTTKWPPLTAEFCKCHEPLVKPQESWFLDASEERTGELIICISDFEVSAMFSWFSSAHQPLQQKQGKHNPQCPR